MIKIKLVVLLLTFSLTAACAANAATIKKRVALAEKVILVDVHDSLVQKTYPNNFQSKYKTADFVYTAKAPIESIFQRFMAWLSHQIARLFKNSNPEQTQKQTVNFVKLIALLIVLCATYFIVKIILNKNAIWIFGSSGRNKINFDAIEENLQNIDFQKLIEQTNKSGNNRLVIRYYYLWVLKQLSEKNVVIIHPEKTNSDYYNEIENLKIKADFKYVSYLYNYIWYGEFDLTTSVYETAKDTFIKILQSI